MANNYVALQDYTYDMRSSTGVNVEGIGFAIQSARKAWSITALNENSVRFELRDGDRFSNDNIVGARVERNEIAAQAQPIADGTPIHIAYGFEVEPGAVNTAYWSVTGQLHYDLAATGPGTSPPFEIGFVDDKMSITVRYGSMSSPQAKVVYLDAQNIERGHLYDIEISTVFDPKGNGRLVVERDGVTLADYSGPLGYQEQNGVYFAYGIYRSDNATETMAVQYQNMQIGTGGDVAFPSKNEFIDAPTVGFGHEAFAAGSNGATLTVSGKTLARATVAIMDGKTQIGTAKADATGAYEADVALTGTGSHKIVTYATDAGGRVGISSQAREVLVTTSADVVARMYALATDTNLSSVVLTGTHALTFTAQDALNYALKSAQQALLSKIEGGTTLLLAQTVTGKGYDYQENTYTSNGQIMEGKRYFQGKLVMDSIFASDGSQTIQAWNANGTSSLATSTAGNFMTSYNTYDAQGGLTMAQTFDTDGSSVTHTYNAATGLETHTSIKAADKSREEIDLNVQGKAYATQIIWYDVANRAYLSERFTNEGVKISSSTFAADSSSNTINFDSKTGIKLTAKATAADGSHVDTTYGVTDKSYVATALHFSAANKLVGRDLFNAAGKMIASEAYNADGSKTVYSVDVTGAVTGYVQTMTDKSHTDMTFLSPGSTQILTQLTYDGSGHLLVKKAYGLSGQLASQEEWANNGSHVLKIYTGATLTETDHFDAAGVLTLKEISPIAGATTRKTIAIADDGTTTTRTLDAQSDRVLSAVKMSADGTNLMRYDGDIKGASYTSELKTFDASGLLVGTSRWTGDTLVYEDILVSDGGHLRTTYGIVGKGYTSQAQSIDASGQLVGTQRFVDGKMVFDQVFAKDGSITLKSWDAENNYTISHHTANSTVTSSTTFTARGVATFSLAQGADGSRESHAFDPTTGQERATVVVYADGSRVESTFGITGKAYTSQVSDYDAGRRPTETLRYSGTKLVFEQKFAGDGSITLKTWSAADETSVTHYDANGALTSTKSFTAGGTGFYAEIRGSDGSSAVHKYDKTTGAETSYVIKQADGAREDANLVVANKSYATQHAFYDAAGRLTDVVRHYGNDTGQVAYEAHYGQDGASTVVNYDTVGREMDRTVKAADGSRDVLKTTYPDAASSIVATVQNDHYAASGQALWSDIQRADGSHSVKALAATTLTSNPGVTDTFISAGADTFVFKVGAGQDTIQKFHLSGPLQDVIQIDHNLVPDFAHLAVRDVGNDTVITLSAHDSITLTNVHTAQLTADYFVFA